jgi:hypothetical protein
LRLGENRRLNKEAHFSQMRRHLFLKGHKTTAKITPSLHD